MIRLVIDINLSPVWVDVLANHWPAVHWSTVGDPRAKDRTVMAWAREHGHVVFTHDLDFGTGDQALIPIDALEIALLSVPYPVR